MVRGYLLARVGKRGVCESDGINYQVHRTKTIICPVRNVEVCARAPTYALGKRYRGGTE